jgi:conjugal transfer ATP-binding protein TraC
MKENSSDTDQSRTEDGIHSAVDAIYENNNMLFLGTSGSGKTVTMQAIATRLRLKGEQCFIIASQMGHEYQRACDKIGGQYTKICSGSNNCINIFNIRVQNKLPDETIEDTLHNTSLLAEKIQNLETAFLLLIPEMTDVQEQLLDEALVETYHHKGITLDNASLFCEGDSTRLKEMPIFEDLYNVMLENPKLEDMAAIIKLFVSGFASHFNGHTNVDLGNKYIIFDISELTDKLLPFGMFVALECIWGKVKEDRIIKKAVFLTKYGRLPGISTLIFLPLGLSL